MGLLMLKALLGWKGYVAAAGAGAFVAGLAVGIGQEWRYQAQIAGIERDQAKAEAGSASAALSSLQSDIETISAAAARAASVAPQLTAEVGQLSEAVRNANPLPNGCRPDSDRVRSFTDAVRATNRAATGQPAR